MENLWHGPTYEVLKLISYCDGSSFLQWPQSMFFSFFLISSGSTQSHGLVTSNALADTIGLLWDDKAQN